MLDYMPHLRIDMKADPNVSEKWLQERIVEDAGLLLLGEVEVKDVERRQPRAGRLDLLLQDPEANTRYEVEIQLGATDESHIIRTIEYWDQERRRYPQYDHVAVIVAEEITARFFNVISLLNGQIPIVALQVQLIQVNGTQTLVFTKVLDHVVLSGDDEESTEPSDRNYWLTQKGSDATLGLADEMLQIAREADPSVSLNYNKHYIGLYSNGVAKNFVQLAPRRSVLIASFRLPFREGRDEELEDLGFDVLPYDKRWKRYRLRLTAADLRERRDHLVSLALESERHHMGVGSDVD
jgi:hypothetical protein